MQNGGPPMQNVGNHRNDGGRLMQASQPFRGEPQRFNEGPPPQQYQGSIGPDRQSHAPYRNLSGGQNPPSAGPPLSARDPPPYNRGPYDQRPEPDMRQSRPDHGPMHANDRMSGPPPQAQGYNSAYGQDRGNFGGPPPPNNFRGMHKSFRDFPFSFCRFLSTRLHGAFKDRKWPRPRFSPEWGCLAIAEWLLSVRGYFRLLS